MAEIFHPDQKSVRLRGKIKFAKGLNEVDTKYDANGRWGCVVYLDSDSLEIVREMQVHGLKNPLKKDDEGYYINLSRPCAKVFKGVRKEFAPPVVRGLDGKNISGNTIGHGSDVEVLMEVYKWKPPMSTKYSVAFRIQEVIVHDLIEFTPVNPNTIDSEEGDPNF